MWLWQAMPFAVLSMSSIHKEAIIFQPLPALSRAAGLPVLRVLQKANHICFR
ncbi:mCG1045154 [Mus musculus]|nr:mCG1045154 [Mus musculus]